MTLEHLKLRNRRGFAALKVLGQQAGTGVLLVAGREETMPPGLTDAARGMVLAEAGNLALGIGIYAACSPARTHSNERRVWRAMTPDAGATAAVFMAHGMAAVTRRLAESAGSELSPDLQDAARGLLHAHFPWGEEDEREIQRTAQGIDPLTLDGLDDAYVGVPLGALRRVVGEAALELPAIAQRFGAEMSERYLASLTWQVCWADMTAPWLTLTDPRGAARAGVRLP